MALISTGNEIVIESAGRDSTGSDPEIVALADGRLVAVWAETLGRPTDLSEDTDGGIFARILDGDGQPLGDVFQVNDAITFTQDRPHVVALENGGFAVGWTATATYGDSPSDVDTFLKAYDVNGAPVAGSAADIAVPDAGLAVQALREMVALDAERVAVILEDGSAYVYRPATGAVTSLAASGVADIAALENGNIIRGAADEVSVKLTLTDGDFGGPEGIAGIYTPLDFYVDGDSDPFLRTGAVELAALRGGGFALAFAEESGTFSSVIRLSILSDEAVIAFEGAPLTRDFFFESPLAEFDMIALSGGGLALAFVTADDGGPGTGIDIALFDADGSLTTRLQATPRDSGTQADPSLTELPDGRIALAYTDDSQPVTAGEVNQMRLALFDVDGAAGRFTGSPGADFLGGIGGNDRIRGLDGDDEIRGRGGDDRLFGDDGADSLFGGAGDDALRGGLGDDGLFGGAGNDGLRGGAGDDRLEGQAGRDVLGGGLGADVLQGGGGDDLLRGGTGNDRLAGGAGADILKGGGGDDRLTGGNGADTFVFVSGQSGSDTVTDFNAGEDVIAIRLRGLSESAVAVTNGPTDTEISFGGDTISLTDMLLDAGDITFAFI